MSPGYHSHHLQFEVTSIRSQVIKKSKYLLSQHLQNNNLKMNIILTFTFWRTGCLLCQMLRFSAVKIFPAT